MKDLYSFHTSEEDLDKFYAEVEGAYERIFEQVGLGDCTYETFASGGIFAKFSHEYQTLLPVGEDTVYYNADRSLVLNKEVFEDEVLEEFGVDKADFTEDTGAEVGNIFKLKFKYSEPLDLKFIDKDNSQKIVYMGCYGIGVSRLMGVIAEKYADEKGLIWPEAIAPFKYYLIGIGEAGMAKAEELYAERENEILFDDRDVRVGEKMADSELMGIPYRVVVSEKTLAKGSAEVTGRLTGKTSLVKLDKLFE